VNERVCQFGANNEISGYLVANGVAIDSLALPICPALPKRTIFLPCRLHLRILGDFIIIDTNH
jgi:hypothetical protein